MKLFSFRSWLWLTSFVYMLFTCQPIWAALTCAEIFAGIKAKSPSVEDGLAHKEAVTYLDGTVATPQYYKGEFTSVKIDVPGHKSYYYERTSQPIQEYSIPVRMERQLLNGSYAGKRVLDVGTGGGKAVIQMRKASVEAHGVDIILDSSQRQTQHFHEYNMKDMDFPNNDFEVIISSFSFFMYKLTRAGERDYAEGLTIMKEFKRLARIGGKIVLGGTPARNVEDIVAAIPGLKISETSTNLARHWTIIERVE